MKRILLLLLLMLTLSGCFGRNGQLREPALLYYPRTEYEFDEPDGVISSEEREATGHLRELDYLLTLYFTGPLDEYLVNPFPEGTSLITAKQLGSHAIIRLTDEAAALSDTDFALACTCLSLTAFEIPDLTKVTITSGPRTENFFRDGFVLYDDYVPEK